MKLLRQLYVQVLIAMMLAILVGLIAPELALKMKSLGDGLIALLRMMLGPIIFCSVVLGLTHVADMRQLGRLALKALVYFEVVTTVAMALGFFAVVEGIEMDQFDKWLDEQLRTPGAYIADRVSANPCWIPCPPSGLCACLTGESRCRAHVYSTEC